MDELQRVMFQTVRGKAVHIFCRPGTNDRMVAESVIVSDEYSSRNLPSAGVMVDVGSHIGSWLTMMLVDDKEARGIAIEPLSVNIEMLERNLAENGVADRATILHGALAKGKTKQKVAWGFSGSELAEMHRYIGDQKFPKTIKHEVEVVDPISVAQVVKEAGGEVAVMKLDCEGGEKALMGTSLVKVDTLVGEYHFAPDDLFKHLRKTHVIESEGEGGIGMFIARRK